ncbi:MAG: hypothetical protein IH946_11105 [Bacteroidetes bacterium]|nr:hypothetical protein [Bacteroidota bacterium]
MDVQKGTSISIGLMGEGLLPGLVIGDATEKTGLGFGIAAKEIGNGINRETFDGSLIDSAQQLSKSSIAFPTNVRMGLSIKWLNTKDLASLIAFDIRYLLVKDSEAITANRWFSPLYEGWASYKPSLFFGGHIELKRKWKLMGGRSLEREGFFVDWRRNILALTKKLGPFDLSISRVWAHSTELNSSRDSWTYFMYGISTNH